jgi:2-C-methyl-D-erythritol 4-phosphate cytidylyltransferase
MQSTLPKQYLALQGKTVLSRSLEALCQHPSIVGVMLVVDLDDPNCPDLQQLNGKPICKAPGGHTRAQSVINGLQMLGEMHIAPETLVAVHDAARPCLAQSDLARVINAACNLQPQTAGAILALPLRETIKQTKSPESALVDQTLDRNRLWAAQTPQIFPLQQLLKALQKYPAATDEAQAMEQSGYGVQLVAGSASNIKITVPEDLRLAQFWLNMRE